MRRVLMIVAAVVLGTTAATAQNVAVIKERQDGNLTLK